jgi:hypothetical protein
MNRILMAGASAIMVTSVAAGALQLAGPAGAATTRAAASSAAAASCRTSHHNYPFPTQAATYKAGPAGSVTIAPVNKGTIKVASVQRAAGYRAFVDSSSGSSVDVYFRGHARHIKFEAEINDWGGLTVTVTNCHS